MNCRISLVSKQLRGVEEFDAQTECGVKQELFAHFVLMTLTRIFSNHTDHDLNATPDTDPTRALKVNFKNALTTVARHIEALPLKQEALVTDTVNTVVTNIYLRRQKLRPNRSFDRRSRKPIEQRKPLKFANGTHNAKAAAA